MNDGTLSLVAENPFYVLELEAGAGAVEVTRQGQRLLGALELGLEGADRYDTPFGPCVRTADSVRRAIAALRDPARRAEHELLALPRGAWLEPKEARRAPRAYPRAFEALPWYRRTRRYRAARRLIST